ncbi:MAG TPA: hypothetical protein VFB80_02200 [Pirellulaceae bacterium]|nr:hypothetical protein [Pirellulaceae bacterium]
MLRLAIVDSDGKHMDAKEIASAVDLVSIAEQARTIIRDCEQLARDKRPRQTAGTGRVPYST